MLKFIKLIVLILNILLLSRSILIKTVQRHIAKLITHTLSIFIGIVNYMKYWWVNHKQTFTDEVSGGYIWSPTKNANGTFNQTYLNLTLTSPGDLIFSYANGQIQAVGIVTSPHREQSKPATFGNIGENWSNLGWLVPIKWGILKTPIKPKDRIEEIAKLLPNKYSPIQSNGNGNQCCYLAEIPDGLGLLLLEWMRTVDPSTFYTIAHHRISMNNQLIREEVAAYTVEKTEREQLIMARNGQGRYRQNLERIENSCRVTGVKNSAFLTASHIKPWRFSSDKERLDGNNGLLLSPHIDKLFDLGLISFDDSGNMLYANQEVVETLKKWGIALPLNAGIFNSSQKAYLKFHRENIFNRYLI